VRAIKKPSVKPVADILNKPVEVVAEFATIERTSPVVTIVPADVNTTAWPLVSPAADKATIVPVVAESAVIPTTLEPVKMPVFVTVKAEAVVEEDVISPKATTAEPPIVVVEGSVTVAPLATVTASSV